VHIQIENGFIYDDAMGLMDIVFRG